MTDSSIQPEFSVVLHLEALGDSLKHFPLEADAAARAALSKRFDLQSIDALTADMSAKRIGGGELILVQGRLKASVVQSCVITGAPVQEEIMETIEERFTLKAEISSEVEISLDDDDPPEPITGNEIDLGEIVAQHLGVALNPYPRAPGAEIPDAYQEDGDDMPDTQKNPFLALAALKKNRE